MPREMFTKGDEKIYRVVGVYSDEYLERLARNGYAPTPKKDYIAGPYLKPGTAKGQRSTELRMEDRRKMSDDTWHKYDEIYIEVGTISWEEYNGQA